MVPSKFGAHIGGSDMFKVHPWVGNAPISEIADSIKPSVDAMFNDPNWWATTPRAARNPLGSVDG
jgi:hypothetical protein